jgi:hypothetical protein
VAAWLPAARYCAARRLNQPASDRRPCRGHSPDHLAALWP